MFFSKLHWIFFLVVFFLISVVFLFFYKKNRTIEKQKKILSQQLLHCQAILKTLPNAWCCWNDGDHYIKQSPAFRKLFHLDSEHSLRVIDFISLLGESSQSPFQRALRHLLNFGGSFTLELELFDGKKHIQIDGYSIDLDPINQTMIVLSIQDITHQFISHDQLERQIETLKKDLSITQNILDTIPTLTWYRTPSGKIHTCNQAYANALDTTVHRVIAENKELIDRFGEVSTFELSRMASSKQTKISVRSHMVINGQRCFLEISEIPIGSNGETIGYAVDISTLESLEKELKLTIQSQKEILNLVSSPIGIYGSDTRMTFFNSAYVTMFQQDANWLATQPTLSEIMDHLRQIRKLPEYTDFREHKTSRVKLFKNLLEPIHEIMHQPDGTICRVVIAPTPVGGLVYIFDNLTDKLSLERRYNTLTAVQKETLDHLYEGIIVFGTDYRLRLSNPAITNIWGLKNLNFVEDEIHINDLLKEITPQFKSVKASKTWRSKMLDILSKRHPERQRIRLKKDKVIECAYVPLPDGSHMLSFIDISDTWRFEKTLQERNMALEHQDRLKSDFIAHVSYELQSPLNTIAGFSDLLMNQYFGELNEKQLDYSRGISDAASRLTNLMNDLVDLAGIQAGTFNLNYQNIPIDQLLSSLVVLVQNRANDHGLELIIDNPLTNNIITIDSKRVRHALFNLLSNAIKFTPTGGQIIIRTHLNKDRHYVDFIIEDTGIGIKENNLHRIERFFKQGLYSDLITSHHDNIKDERSLKMIQIDQNDEDVHGYVYDHETDHDHDEDHTIGLGLTLVHRLIELHGGCMHIESQVNKGTLIQCTLPIKPFDKK